VKEGKWGTKNIFSLMEGPVSAILKFNGLDKPRTAIKMIFLLSFRFTFFG